MAEPLSKRELAILERELQESAEKAMPSNTADALQMSMSEKAAMSVSRNIRIGLSPSSMQAILDAVDKNARPKPPELKQKDANPFD